MRIFFSKNLGEKMEKGKEENIKRRKIYFFFAEETKHGEGKGGLYLEKEIIFSEEDCESCHPLQSIARNIC